jgi:hypothetical protein
MGRRPCLGLQEIAPDRLIVGQRTCARSGSNPWAEQLPAKRHMRRKIQLQIFAHSELFAAKASDPKKGLAAKRGRRRISDHQCP